MYCSFILVKACVCVCDTKKEKKKANEINKKHTCSRCGGPKCLENRE